MWAISVLCLLPMELFAWTNGRLLVWMDSERAQGARAIAKKFEHDFGIEQHTDYDLHDVGVATPGAVTGLSKIIDLVHAGIFQPAR